MASGRTHDPNLPSVWFRTGSDSERRNAEPLSTNRERGTRALPSKTSHPISPNNGFTAISGIFGNSRVESPESEVQRTSKRDPGQIRHEQRAREPIGLVERDHCGCESQPQKQDVHQGEAQIFRPETQG